MYLLSHPLSKVVQNCKCLTLFSISHNIWKLLLLGRRGVGVRGGSAAQQHHQHPHVEHHLTIHQYFNIIQKAKK